MKELTDLELYHAIEYAKSIDEDAAQKIMVRIQLDQTALAQTIFDIFPSVIAEQDQDMAYLFMDLCFDAICIFEDAFGPLPSQSDMDIDWLEKQAVLLDAEMQALMKGNDMNEKIRARLKDRLINRTIEDNPQHGLVKFMNAVIDEFASESENRTKAIPAAQSMIFVTIRLLSNLYNQSANY